MLLTAPMADHRLFNIQEFEKLRERSTGVIEDGIGAIFVQKVPLLKHYGTYCSNHVNIPAKLAIYKSRSTDFADFLEVGQA